MTEQVTTLDALVQTQPVRDLENTSGATVDLIAAGNLILNDQTLPALTLPAVSKTMLL